jgi:hypothetical protein
MLDDVGRELPVLARPQEQWVEAGGAAGTTANGVYRFGGDGCPREFAVSWQGKTVRLPVVERRE